MARKSPQTTAQLGVNMARPDLIDSAFAAIYCAEHFFSGPWPCSCPPGPQWQALTSNADEISLGGARGGAKSETALAFTLKGNIGMKSFSAGSVLSGADASYILHPNYRCLVMIEQANGLTYLLDRAETLYGPLGLVGGRITRGDPPEARFSSGAKILFGYFGEDGWKKSMGPEYQRIIIDQMEMMARRETHDRIMGSLRSRWPEMKPQALSTWNPGGGDDLRGAPGQGWIMDYFRVNDYITGKLAPGTIVRDSAGKTTLFIPSKVTDNPFLRWAFEKAPDGRLLQLMSYKCCTCGYSTESIDEPERCSNPTCLTNLGRVA